MRMVTWSRNHRLTAHDDRVKRAVVVKQYVLKPLILGDQVPGDASVRRIVQGVTREIEKVVGTARGAAKASLQSHLLRKGQTHPLFVLLGRTEHAFLVHCEYDLVTDQNGRKRSVERFLVRCR